MSNNNQLEVPVGESREDVHRHVKDACYVENVNGVQFVFMPDGTKIPCQIMTRVSQGMVDGGIGPAVAIIKVLVNLK